MPPRKSAAVVSAPVAPVVSAPVAPVSVGSNSTRQFRILESSIVCLDGSPEVRFNVDAGKKKKGDPTVVPGKTPGGAAKKAFTRMVTSVTNALKASSEDTENLTLAYRFAIQEEGHKPHWYECRKSPLEEPKVVNRSSKDGTSTAITIRNKVECKAWKDPNAPVKAPRAAASQSPVDDQETEVEELEEEDAPPPPPAPVKRGKGKGKSN
jgi:hypothetical protein